MNPKNESDHLPEQRADVRNHLDGPIQTSAAPQAHPMPLIRKLVIQEKRRADPAVGHLGRISASIPRCCAHFLEYYGDPFFTEPRKGPRPERMFESGIRTSYLRRITRTCK